MKRWVVQFRKACWKAQDKLPSNIRDALKTLSRDIEQNGPVRGDWPNYSKLGKNRHHCHLNKQGRPTYVAVWTVEKDKILVEVEYVGTREKAPY